MMMMTKYYFHCCELRKKKEKFNIIYRATSTRMRIDFSTTVSINTNGRVRKKGLTGCFVGGRMDGLRIAVRGSYGGEIAGISRGNVIARGTRRAMARCHGNGFAWSAAR